MSLFLELRFAVERFGRGAHGVARMDANVASSEAIDAGGRGGGSRDDLLGDSVEGLWMERSRFEPDDDAAAPAPRVDTPPSPPGGPDVAGGVGSPPCADAEPRGTFSRILSPEQGDATANLIADYYESPTTKPRAESFSETLSETPSVDVATTSLRSRRDVTTTIMQ